MKPGDSVLNASRSEHDDAGRSGAVAGTDHDKLTWSPRTQESLEDIQGIVDKLAALTRQLGRPVRTAPGILTLGPEVSQQAHAIGGAERSGAQQGDGADVAGNVRLALQVDATG
jgi:hypothetical protein